MSCPPPTKKGSPYKIRFYVTPTYQSFLEKEGTGIDATKDIAHIIMIVDTCYVHNYSANDLTHSTVQYTNNHER